MDYYSTKIKCPFWSKTQARENKIFCEGPVEAARLQLWFCGSEKNRRIHLARYCCAKFERCPVYQATLKKYEE